MMMMMQFILLLEILSKFGVKEKKFKTLFLKQLHGLVGNFRAFFGLKVQDLGFPWPGSYNLLLLSVV